jgi:outer membrane protein assembly factor BamB
VTRRVAAALTVAAVAASAAAILDGQGRGAVEWTTNGFDAQRSAWIRTDPRLSVEAMQKPGAFGAFKFLWKLKLEHDPNAATTLTEPILLDRLIGFRGFKSIAFVATASETVHAIDVDVGVPLWKYHINYSASPPQMLAATPACPGGLSATLSRPTTVAPFAFAAGGGGGEGRSGGGVGEPGRGASTLPAAGRGRGAAPAPAVAPPANPAVVPGSAAAAANLAPGGLPGGARQGGPGGAGVAFAPGADAAYVIGSDGYLHALNVSNGWDNMTPALFLPANTRAVGLIVASGGRGEATAYAATTHGCGSQADAVWAMDLASPKKTVAAFKAGGATIAGAAGVALGRDGSVYAATTDGSATLSNAIIALESTTLKLKSSAVVAKADFMSSPLLFRWKEREVMIVAGRGRLFVFDTATLQIGAVASASIGTAGPEPAGALASWLDADDTRWIAVPAARGIETFMVVEQSGQLALQPRWTSRAIASPLPPLVVNGVLFAASSGTRSAPGVLYAIDAASGKDLWNSGRAIATAVRGGLSAGGGNVYVPGSDSTLYAFGFDIEK